ncbi:MAG: NADH-quinone oxidoreductase subunit [Clostridia bacterium]|nr:NADH-quinone oxidoreductase subunit [Clostridia bacterium]
MPWLSLLLVLPVLGALIIFCTPREQDKTVKAVALLIGILETVISLGLYFSYDFHKAGLQFIEEYNWITTLNIKYFLGVDGLSLPMVVLTTFIFLCAVLASWGMSHRVKEYFFLIMIMETAVLGVFTSLDLFLFFLFWELELIPMYLLIGIWGSARREYAAMKFIIYTMTGSAFLLAGFLAMYFLAPERTFDITQLAKAGFAPGVQSLLFVLIFLGFAVKLPVFPFHTWLPDAHVEAPAPVSMILAGVLLKMGGYGLIRINVGLLPEGVKAYIPLLATLAIINVLYGAYVALGQKDLKTMIAMSSVSHMGFVLLPVAAMTPLALNGAVLEMFAHGTVSALLFFCVGLIYERAHTREIKALEGGLAACVPKIAVAFIIGGLASLGLPGMSQFIAEFLVFLGSFPVLRLPTVLGTTGIVFTAGYILWAIKRIFYGPLNPKWAHLKDMQHSYEYLPVVILVGLTVLIGFYPALITNWSDSSLLAMLR